MFLVHYWDESLSWEFQKAKTFCKHYKLKFSVFPKLSKIWTRIEHTWCKVISVSVVSVFAVY